MYAVRFVNELILVFQNFNALKIVKNGIEFQTIFSSQLGTYLQQQQQERVKNRAHQIVHSLLLVLPMLLMLLLLANTTAFVFHANFSLVVLDRLQKIKPSAAAKTILVAKKSF